MHPIAFTSRKSRRIWFVTVLTVLLVCRFIIQSVQAASIYIIGFPGSGYPSVALLNGKPIVSHYDYADDAIKLTFCDDAACTTFANTVRQIDTLVTTNAPSVVTVINGNPLIAYQDSANADLKVAACSDPTCTTPPTITLVDSQLNPGAFSNISMTVISGNPVISYQDINLDIRLAICVDPACATPAIIRTIQSSPSGAMADFSNVVSLNGNPVVSYTFQSGGGTVLSLSSCIDPTCAATPVHTGFGTVSNATAGEHSMLIVDGKPLIAFDSGTGVKVSKCADPTCSAGTVTNNINNASAYGVSLTIINNLPVVAYGASRGGSDHQLRLATCSNITCSSSTITNLTGIVDAGVNPSLINLNNLPAIAYYDDKNSQIRFYYGGNEGHGLDITPTPSPTATATRTSIPTPTPYATPGQVGTLVPLAPAASDAYGSAVAVSGDTVVVGAPYNDHSALTDAGKVYIYKWNGTIWAFQAEITPSDAGAGDKFGATVGIYGDTIIAGAPGDDDGGADSGSAYIFVRSGSTWSQQQKLLSPDANTNDRFGNAVSISVDSVLIGASGDDQAGADAGAAYVFARTGTDWSLQQKLMAGDPVAGSQFGSAVDLYGDTAVIGAPLPDTQSGAAYVFVRQWNTPNWSQQQKLIPDLYADDPGDHFGAAVAVYHETIVIGAPQAEGSAAAGLDEGALNIFNRSGGVWTRNFIYSAGIPTAQPSEEPQYGAFAVDVYRETFLAGVPGRRRITSQYPGAAYFISGSGSSPNYWLMGTPAANHAQVGASVARDGNTIVVGAPADDFVGYIDSGAAYIFRVVAPPFQPTASATPSFTPSPTLTPSHTPSPTATPYTPTSPPDSTPGPHFFATRHPTFTWDNITWALGYQIEIDDDPNFGSPISDETDANTLSYTTFYELADGIYYWHVRAKVNSTDWGTWSDTETIIVSAP